MFFTGGMIPTFLIVQRLHLLNTMWALILPKMCIRDSASPARFFRTEHSQMAIEGIVDVRAGAVSYTHLDVYKRQARESPCAELPHGCLRVCFQHKAEYKAVAVYVAHGVSCLLYTSFRLRVVDVDPERIPCFDTCIYPVQ